MAYAERGPLRGRLRDHTGRRQRGPRYWLAGNCYRYEQLTTRLMHRGGRLLGMIQMRAGLAIGLMLALSACEQTGTQAVMPGPTEAAAAAPLDFSAGEGKTYAAFAAETATQRYALDALGLSANEQARFQHAMARAQPGIVAQGGGAEALVFSGCAPTGCLEGLAVVAIDTTSGDVFVGVSDMGGAEKLVPNDRLEALLRLTSPSQTWDDPVRPAGAFATTAAP